MTIHFYAKGDETSATARFRCYLLASELRKLGVDARVHEPPTGRLSRGLLGRLFEAIRYVTFFVTVRKEDVIYLVRTVYRFDFFILAVLAKVVLRKRIIFDFDDPIYLRKQLYRRMAVLTRIADSVVVGSHELAKWAKRLNRQVHIIPTSIPFNVYSRFGRDGRDASNTFTIGWIGFGVNHLDNLKILHPVFEKLMSDGVSFKVLLIGAQNDMRIHGLFQDIPGIDAEFIDQIDWANIESSPKQIQRFDIGLMPLLDNEWNRAKCAFKAIEYMACGVPAVISPVGENNYLIQDGVNGFLADTVEEWVEKIARLYHDRELLARLGQTGQQTVRDKYSLEVNAPKVMDIINCL